MEQADKKNFDDEIEKIEKILNSIDLSIFLKIE